MIITNNITSRICARYMYSNSLYCKIRGFKTIMVAQYTWSKLYYEFTMSLLSTRTMQSVCLYNTECRQPLSYFTKFTSLMVILILFCSPKRYESQSGSRLLILREPFSVYRSFSSSVFIFTTPIHPSTDTHTHQATNTPVPYCHTSMHTPMTNRHTSTNTLYTQYIYTPCIHDFHVMK